MNLFFSFRNFYMLLIIQGSLLSFSISAQLVENEISKHSTILPEIIVTDSVLSNFSNSVIPTQSANVSVYGLENSVLDVPRSLTSATQTELQANQIQNLTDLVKISSSSYGPTVFGNSSLPYIRGQEGEIFVNSLRRITGNVGYGVPISFNSLQSLEIVKGPSTPALGPTQRVGGYVNFTTKRAPLQKPALEMTASYGSYDKQLYSLDMGVPLIPNELGFRVSYEQRDEGSFYRHVNFHSQNLYWALDWKPTSSFTVEINGEWHQVDFMDNAGFNRPTNELIREGRYILGQGISRYTGTIPGPRAIISPTGSTIIDRSQTLVDPNGRNTMSTYLQQMMLQWNISDDLKLINRTHFQTLNRESNSSISFNEIVDRSYLFENRSELVWDWEINHQSRKAPPTEIDSDTVKKLSSKIPQEAIRVQSMIGFDFRWNYVKAYSQFNTLASNPIDATQNLDLAIIPANVVALLTPTVARYGSLFSPGGTYDLNGDGISEVNGNNDTNESTVQSYGIFMQHDIHFNDQWNLLFGARGDLNHVESVDPLPPPGQNAAYDEITVAQGAANISLLYKPRENVSLYMTYSYSQSSLPDLGGGYALNKNELQRDSFQIASQLWETGVKITLLENKLYLDGALFTQSRNLRQRDGSSSKIQVPGAEMSLIYEADRNCYFKLGGTYLNARYDHSSPTQLTRQVEDAFDNSRPDLIEGTGVGSPNYTVFPPGDYRVTGMPHFVFNASLSYQFDWGLGFRIGSVYTTEQNVDVLGQVTIPDQITINCGIFYTRANWEISLDVLNLTDEENWTTTHGQNSGADSVYPEEPIRFVAALKFRF